MRTTLIGMSLAFALAGSALADGYVDPKSFVAPPPPIWSGWYLGAGAGYGHAATKDDYSEVDTGVPFSSSFDGQAAQGGLVRFMLGVDRQIKEKFVLGVFADIDWTDINQRFTATSGGIDDGPIDDELTLEWQWAIGGRAGYLFTPTTMLYFLAGYTQAHFKSDGWYDIYGDTGDFLPGKSAATFNGYVVGFGMETLIGHNLFLRGEMRYSEFDGQVINSGVLDGDPFTDSEHPTLLTGMLGITYKFGHRDRDVEPLK
jgi:outer membrane immunogenic protein